MNADISYINYLYSVIDSNYQHITSTFESVDQRIDFEKWLLGAFSPNLATKQDFERHTKLISTLCAKARKYPCGKQEDLLLASLISKAEPLKTDAGYYDIIDRKIRHMRGMTINVSSIFYKIKNANLPLTCLVLLKRLVEKRSLRNILEQSILQKNISMIKVIVQNYYNEFVKIMDHPNEDGDTLLMIALEEKEFEIIKYLAEAYPKGLKLQMKMVTKDGDHPLHAAICNRSDNILKFLAEFALVEFKEASKILTPEGNNLLHTAILECTLFINILAKIVPDEFKSMVKTPNKDGDTPVHYAMVNSRLIVQLFEQAPEAFIEAMYMRSKNGGTPLHCMLVLKMKDNGEFFNCIIPQIEEILKCILKLIPKEFNQLLILQDKYKNTPVHLAARSPRLLKCLGEIAPEGFTAALILMNESSTPIDIIRGINPENYEKMKHIFSINSEAVALNQETVFRKSLGHVFHLKGITSIFDAKTNHSITSLRIEGHQSPYWFHLIAESFIQFSQRYPKALNEIEVKLLLEAVKRETNPTEYSLEETLKRIKQGFLTFVESGYPGHRVIFLFWGNHFIICNRGGSTRRPIEVYHFDPEKITVDFLENMSIAKETKSDIYKLIAFHMAQEVLGLTQTDFDRQIEKASFLPYQEIGNCSYVSPITSIYTAMLLIKTRGIDEHGLLLKETTEKIQSDLVSTNIKKALDLYQNFLIDHQISVLETNIRPLESGSNAFHPDHRLIMNSIRKACLLPFDELSEKRLDEIVGIYYIYLENRMLLNPNEKCDLTYSEVASWKLMGRVSIL